MTNPGEDAGATPPSDAAAGAESSAASECVRTDPPPATRHRRSSSPPPLLPHPTAPSYPRLPRRRRRTAAMTPRRRVLEHARPVTTRPPAIRHPDSHLPRRTIRPPAIRRRPQATPPGHTALRWTPSRRDSVRRSSARRAAPGLPAGAALRRGPGIPAGYRSPPQAGTNSLAIGSLIASLVGVIWGGDRLIGIVLGVVALNQIKQSNQGGRGLAVAGIAVGALTSGVQPHPDLRAAVSDGPQQPPPGDPNAPWDYPADPGLPPPVHPDPRGRIPGAPGFPAHPGSHRPATPASRGMTRTGRPNRPAPTARRSRR